MKKKLNIIKNDSDVAELCVSSEEMLLAVIKQFSLNSEVILFETIHGHIAMMKVKEGHFVQGDEGKPARLGIEELNFLKGLSVFRHIEATTDQIKIGFTNKLHS